MGASANGRFLFRFRRFAVGGHISHLPTGSIADIGYSLSAISIGFWATLSQPDYQIRLIHRQPPNEALLGCAGSPGRLYG